MFSPSDMLFCFKFLKSYELIIVNLNQHKNYSNQLYRVCRVRNKNFWFFHELTETGLGESKTFKNLFENTQNRLKHPKMH